LNCLDIPSYKIRASPVDKGHHKLIQKADVAGSSREHLKTIRTESIPLDQDFLGLISTYLPDVKSFAWLVDKCFKQSLTTTEGDPEILR
jgi:hypothetical protein